MLLGSACRSNRIDPSVWPPDDFSIRVAGTRYDQDTGARVLQRFRVGRDGFAVYREARNSLPSEELALPVFDTVSVWRMRRESVRTLGRLLARARLFDTDVGQAVNRAVGDPEVVVAWTAFGASGQISSYVDSGGVLDRVVRILNAYAPVEHEFDFPELSGEAEPRRATRVPRPLAWVEGSLRCHEQFVEIFPDDTDLWIDLFALAYVERDFDVADEAFDRIVSRGPEGWPGAAFAVVDWETDCVAPLRGLLDRLQQAVGRGGGGD